jgi:hypothetical protein
VVVEDHEARRGRALVERSRIVSHFVLLCHVPCYY